MPGWLSRRSPVEGDARRRQVTAQARAILARLRAEGQPPAYLRALEPFVELAPEVLALGPAPASLTMRVLYGLCAFKGEARKRFGATMAEEFASPSPTLRMVLRDGLVQLDPDGQPRVTDLGQRLFQRLRGNGAFEQGAED